MSDVRRVCGEMNTIDELIGAIEDPDQKEVANG
jgi:hypothetical protein